MTPDLPANAVIAVVDDNTTNLRILSAYLEAAGFSVRVSQDGKSAIRAATRQLPDLILLDILMPGIDGFETCKRLKNNPLTREIPVIFTSALSEPVDRVRGLSLGAVDYITKPFQRDEVIARINLHLKMRRLTQTLAAQNRRLQQEIHSRRHAEGANRAKSQFLAKMSHELRTPLNAIMGFSQLLSRDVKLSEEQQDYLGAIHRSGEHLLALINDVLDLSKIEAGKATLRETHFDLDRVLKNLLEMLELKARGKGLTLHCHVAEDVPRHICADEGKLRQVLLNLLGNAVKFAEAGSVTLRVGAQQPEGDRLRLLFEVEDTGSGIAPEELERVFEPFVQAQFGYRASEGTGLGLSIARQLVQLMGGDVTLDSTLGSGTIAKFDVRVRTGNAAESAVVKEVAGSASRRVVGLKSSPPPRLLVVDDRPDSRLFLVKLLEIVGFDVCEAADGEAAIACWQAEQPDLVWMDLRMPGLDGYETARRIRAEQAAAGLESPRAIVALTASTFEEDAQAMQAAGLDDLVRKPFQERDIFEAIAHHLHIDYRYDDENEAASEAVTVAADVGEPTLEMFEAMPRDWLDRLYRGAMSANEGEVCAAIEAVAGDRPEFARGLLAWLTEFRYDRLFELAGAALSPEREATPEP